MGLDLESYPRRMGGSLTKMGRTRGEIIQNMLVKRTKEICLAMGVDFQGKSGGLATKTRGTPHMLEDGWENLQLH